METLQSIPTSMYVQWTQSDTVHSQLKTAITEGPKWRSICELLQTSLDKRPLRSTMGLSGRKEKQKIPNDPRNLSWADSKPVRPKIVLSPLNICSRRNEIWPSVPFKTWLGFIEGSGCIWRWSNEPYKSFAEA